MRRIAWIVGLLILMLPGCSASSDRRVVRVDYRQDEFASFYWRFFPRSVEAHPGDELVFDQQWTGEPHTVTLGTNVDRAIPASEALEKKYNSPIVVDGTRYANFDAYAAMLSETEAREAFARAEKEFNDAMRGVVRLFPYTGGVTAQNASQPCYLTRGDPPTDPRSACAKRDQPAFNGRQSYYSSGFIPPSGPSGNTYRVRLAEDIEPGTYRYTCVIHDPYMRGEIVVKPRGAKVASQAEVNLQARREIEGLAKPLRQAYADAKVGRATYAGRPIPLPMGGYHPREEFTTAVLEFVPRTLTTKVGRPVTWTLVGAHTVSFGVPRYVPIYFVRKDGTVRRNPVVDRAAGGSPTPPPVSFEGDPVRIDGGTYSGSGFYSSGLLGSDPFSTYTLRFAKAGRYRFACLIHPEMVGSLVVTG